MGSGISSNMTPEENAYICTHAQGLHNQRNEYTISDEDTVIIYLASLAFYTIGKRGVNQNLRLQAVSNRDIKICGELLFRSW